MILVSPRGGGAEMTTPPEDATDVRRVHRSSKGIAVPDIMVRDPFNEMRSFMRRAFSDLGGWDPFSDNGGASLVRRAHCAIPLDVYESADGLTVQAPVPGFTKDEIDVTYERGKLSIRTEHASEKQGEQDVDGRTYFLREVEQGVHSRSLRIGAAYDPDSIHGDLKDGVLTLQIQRAAAAQPRKVPIQAEA